jgi:V/A-type H+-transporting ATPase subunit A
MDYFKKLINLGKQMNYAKYKSEAYENYRNQIRELVAEKKSND